MPDRMRCSTLNHIITKHDLGTPTNNSSAQTWENAKQKQITRTLFGMV